MSSSVFCVVYKAIVPSADSNANLRLYTGQSPSEPLVSSSQTFQGGKIRQHLSQQVGSGRELIIMLL